MKTISTVIFLVISFFVSAQTTDILYIPSQKSLVLTYNSNYSPLGFYTGGYFRTSFPSPYTYTTPMSIFNRVGITYNFQNKYSIMGGGFFETYSDKLSIQPDIWVKVNPLRILLKTEKGFDFSLGLNYMKGFRYGVGVSIPFR